MSQHSETIEIKGHIIDSAIFPKVLDELIESGADYEILDMQVGKTQGDTSYARIRIWAADASALDTALRKVHPFGATPLDTGEAALVPAPADGVFPDGFYSTTNLPTQLRINGAWVDVSNPEMDCGVVVENGNARTIAMSDVRKGQQLVVGRSGVRVTPIDRPRGIQEFEFMGSEVSSEKPKELAVQRVAAQMREVKKSGGKVLWVLGPAAIHTGGGPDLAALVEAGWVDVLFAGNGFATHDIESSLYRTSLGVYLHEGTAAEGGHEHHIRAINAVRASGSIAKAVEEGKIKGGVMHALVRKNIPFVLGGSVRDDGPLPDTVTDILETQRRMRELIAGVGICIVVASMLHGIATGNILPASVPIVCVDINPSTVTKLMDRGSHQSSGLVTDVGLFVSQLKHMLVS